VKPINVKLLEPYPVSTEIVTEGFNSLNIVMVRERELLGTIPKEVGFRFRQWLDAKVLLSTANERI